ncbi:MAG: PEP-CTERM sorting domain-containing protein, partial [Methylococcaceae bacterium]
QEFAVLWNGAQIFFNNVGNDTSNNYIFTNLLATDTQTVLSFNNRNDAAYNVLDNVSVSAVPVPAAIWLFGTGLLSLTGFSRKRNAT